VVDANWKVEGGGVAAQAPDSEEPGGGPERKSLQTPLARSKSEVT